MSRLKRLPAYLCILAVVAVTDFAVAGSGRARAVTDRPSLTAPGTLGSAIQTLPKLDYKPEDMTKPAFAKLALGAKWVKVPMQEPRRCRGAKGCEKQPGTTTRAEIDAALNARKELDLDNIPGAGVIVAKVTVVPYASQRPRPDEKKYLMSGGQYAYFLVVLSEPDEDADGYRTRKWQMVEVDLGDSTHRVVKNGVFKRCVPLHNPESDETYADFNYCTVDHREYARIFRQLRLASTDAARARYRRELRALTAVQIKASGSDILDAPAWISCIHGCCIAETY